METAAENSDADLARQRAVEEVGWALREMTSNLLRIVRGAGKAYEIGRQAQALVEAFISYREAVGHFPPSEELSRLLSVDLDREMLARCSEDSRVWAYAEERIIRGVLQIVASRLVDQKTQEATGKTAMYDGIRDIEAAREENRRALAQASRTRAKSRAPLSRPRKPKARDG